MTYALTTPLPFGAGSSLCPPDFEPPCTCPPDGRIDPDCPVDGDRELPGCAGGSPASVPAGVGAHPVADPGPGESNNP